MIIDGCDTHYLLTLFPFLANDVPKVTTVRWMVQFMKSILYQSKSFM